MGKYDLLGKHFESQAGVSWHATFEEIEQILRFPLPASARAHQAWWANGADQRPQKAAWRDAGWSTRDLNLTAGHVLFVRDGMAAADRPRQEQRPAESTPKTAASAAHGWDDADTLDFRFGLAWVPIGRIGQDAGGKLVLPAAEALPAIYRFRIRRGNAEQRYIGQTENLARRFGFYRNPGPTQQTNVRLNAEFLRGLAAGAEISVAAVTDGAWIDRGGGPVAADMASLATRCLLENAAILAVGAIDVESLNRSEAAARLDIVKVGPAS